MQTEEMIELPKFCSSHGLEISFIQSLENQGLINIVIVNQTLCVRTSDLPRLEQVVRLYGELDINPEGIDAIGHLLDRIEDLQHEIISLRNRLSLYEEENTE
jgi:chaperone modulatory protein CbpM